MLNTKVNNQINNIVQINLDAADGFREAGSAVSDTDLQIIFNASSANRKQYADIITTEINKHGNNPETEGSIEAALHRTWMTFKADITTHNEEAIVEECIRGEEVAIETSKEVLGNTLLPLQIRNMINDQYLDIIKNLRQLKEWKKIFSEKLIHS